MPLYEYECPECGVRTEIYSRLDDSDRLVICMECYTFKGHKTVVMTKVPSRSSFRMKGYASRNGYSSKT